MNRAVSDGWRPPDLAGKVCVVTGSSRGVGKGIALVLGEAGATVYVTGRTRRGRPAAGPVPGPGSVDETAEQITARGGRGIPSPTDHTHDGQVEALFTRVYEEQGRLDLLVANAWGGYEGMQGEELVAPFWEQPLRRWDVMFGAGLRAQFSSARLAAPLMIEQGSGLIVCTGGFDDPSHYLGSVPYDVVKTATGRLVTTMAHELRPHGVAAAGVYPGFTRTEAVVEAFAAEGREPPPETHSPEFVGRAVACLLADPELMELSGSGVQAATLAQRYGFRDTDGREIAHFVLPEEYRL
ncbi:MAG: oxidoreductase [Candidatus Nephthysia bennettiae]|uniref:SDR family NAD(P)-dependent oxidoreductase n=1 Tax=Candidatus Nephthysia bennettiae TaxID=3127016 RepID=A0A934N7M8_9BACT|nr:SDR family NAD(P)-dependent oxidoreductase [Candidatus Dormibacteraeota bacterium]MBJ7613115.1 SDR family NAD(P)-dependent oxidoreductase [Candidatus Dormibacteraeota bacterium]PZR86880.1 MAG: oxidoreductase [Candidatus Dormibacteraeota bacterium]